MLKKYLTIFLISMVPILELRGAIPYSVGFGLPSIPSFIVCVIGNMIPVPFIYWFARRVLEWGKDKRFIGKFFTGRARRTEAHGKVRHWSVYRTSAVRGNTTSGNRGVDRNTGSQLP